MASLDTNVLLRWLLNDSPEHSTRAESLIGSGAQLRVDDVALIELIHVLESVMHISREAIRSSVQLVIATGNLELDRSKWSGLMDVYVSHPKLSVTDIHLTRQAHEHDATPLYTFDKKLATQLEGAALA